MVTVIIPSRNERFLHQTVNDVLYKAKGEVELIVCLDGYWPTPALPDHPNIRIIHRGNAVGMRDNINAAVAIARGKYVLKTDAHCMFEEGYDLELASKCDGDWIVIPRRYALDAENWVFDQSNPRKYPIDYHYLSYPYERPGDPTCGLHGTPWPDRKRARADVMLDDEMSSQGSCWFMPRAHFNRIGPMDTTLYGPFVSEFQELGLKTWLGGGSVKVNKNTWYAHLYKGRKYGRGYTLGPNQFSQGPAVTDHWMNNRWPGQIHDMAWLVEKFWPVPSWPADWLEKVA
jgi:glycosyltransferase involved in cell wall biosynthesis